MPRPTGYEPKIQVHRALFNNFVIQLGSYNIFVFNPKNCCRYTCCLHPKTLLLPKRNAALTFLFIFSCFVALEYLAEMFASRPLTKIQVLMDFGLVLGTINAGIATCLSDPGIVPPELAPDEIAEDSEQQEEGGQQQQSTNQSTNVQRSSTGFRRRAASIDAELDDASSGEHDPFAITTLNPYLADAGTHPQYADDFDAMRLSNCKHCQHMRPQKSAHCPKCKTCVMGFDHHCGFLSTDIGERNLRHFIVFLVHCFLCVAMSAAAFIKPWFYLVVWKDGEMVAESNWLVLAALALFLSAWGTLLFYMALNYLIMAFVPGSKNTRDVWRKWCGKNPNNNNSSTSATNNNDPLPEWHPGYQQQQRELEEKKKEESEMRVWKILFGVQPSLLPAWSNDLLNFDEDDLIAEQIVKKEGQAGSGNHATSGSSKNEGGAVIISDKENLISKKNDTTSMVPGGNNDEVPSAISAGVVDIMREELQIVSPSSNNNNNNNANTSVLTARQTSIQSIASGGVASSNHSVSPKNGAKYQ